MQVGSSCQRGHLAACGSCGSSAIWYQEGARLLVPPLHAAVALKQVHRVAEGVRKDLDLDVARPRDVALQQHALVAECRRRLTLGRAQGLLLRHTHRSLEQGCDCR